MSKMMKAKKFGSWFMLSLFPMLAFVLSMMFSGDFVLSLILGTCISILCIVIAHFFFLNHPMIRAIEGDGLMVNTLDSTGLIRYQLARVVPPYVQSKIFGKGQEIAFDRTTMWYAKRFANGTIEEDDKNVYLKLPKKEYSKSIFMNDGLPTLVYNNQLNCFLTKDFLSEKETETFAKHLVIYLTRRTEELSGHIRDFARHVVEQTRPKTSFWEQNRWVVALGLGLIILVVIVIAAMFMPAVSETIGGAMSNSALAQNTQPVNPV